MGNYVTPQEVVSRYNIFQTGSMSLVSSDMIYYAAREVESRLSKCFSVPFSADYPTVKDLVIDACFVRYKRMTDPKYGERLEKIFDGRIERIISGTDFIMTDSGYLERSSMNGADTPESIGEDYYSVHSMLGAENEHTRIDEDLLDDLEDERDD